MSTVTYMVTLITQLMAILCDLHLQLQPILAAVTSFLFKPKPELFEQKKRDRGQCKIITFPGGFLSQFRFFLSLSNKHPGADPLLTGI